MAFVIDRFWLPLLLAGIIGLMIGWATCGRSEKSWLSSWLPLGLLAAIIAAFAVAQAAVPGRYGLWLETALAMFVVYLAGCCVACLMHGLAFGPPRAAFRDPNADLVAKKAAGIDSIADERAARADAAARTPSRATADVIIKAAEDTPRTGGIVPPLLNRPRGGERDDLTLIWGVAAPLQEKLNHLGIWHFDQIAAWTTDHISWFERQLEGMKGRVARDKWIEQCVKLAGGWRPDHKAGQRPEH